MEIKSAQSLMLSLYGERDHKRGSEKTFLWLVEEIGEVAEALREHDKSRMNEELADVLAWLFSLGNVLGVDLESAFREKYNGVCPKCKDMPCGCA